MPLVELLANPYFSAGFGLLGIGVGMNILRLGLKHGTSHLRRNMLVSMEIPSKDKSFPWVMEWVSLKEGRRTQHVSVETVYQQFENGEIDTKIELIPSPGIHYFKHKNHWIQVERAREKNVVDFSSGNLWESVTFTTLGRNRAVLEDILNEAKTMALKKHQGSTVIYTSSGGDWRKFGFPRKKRPLHSVILDKGQSEKLLNDVREFLNSSRWYIDRGIPYRRGYLLHGPPGTGKSSFISALAGELGLNICVLNLNSKGISNDSLNYLLNTAPQRSIILLEDIDAALDEKGPSILTFSGLLNALDGVAATEGGGRILFMTTNYIERLHPALIRPGRVDIRECLGYATPYQIEALFTQFYPGEEQLAKAFSSKIGSKQVSMAQLQAHFLQHKNKPKLALDNFSLDF